MAALPSRVVLGAGLAVAVALSGSPLASAQPAGQPAAPVNTNKQMAKQLTKAGLEAQDAGDYDRAITLYKQAYAQSPHPVLVANIALAHRLAGRNDEALTYYERYLVDAPDGAEAGPSRVAVAELKAAGATSKPELLDLPPPATAEPKPAAAPASPRQSLEPEPAGRTDTVASPGRSLRITGLVLGGAGIASLAAGAYFGLRVRSIEADAADAANGGASSRDLEDMFKADGDAAERNQFICYGVGAALVIGGAVTYWLGARQGRSAPTTAWMPVVSPSFAGLALTGALR